jgi:hypothetical protein
MKTTLIAILSLASLGVILMVLLTPRGDRRLDEWIARQLVGIVNAYLFPRLDFGTLRYEPPLTVRLTGVSLVAPDGTRLLDVQALDIALAEVPRLGRPIRIARLDVTGGRVNLIREHATPDRRAGFKGLSPLFRGDHGEVDPNYRLSNVLRLERVTLRDCALRYDPADDSGIMELPGLALDMGISRAADYADAGWYAIALDSGRAPGAVIRARGALNIDTLAMDIHEAALAVDLSPTTIGTLPPPLQELLRRHDARGRLALSASGRLEPESLATGDLQVTIDLDDFNFAAGEFRIPIDRASAGAVLSSGRIDLPAIEVNTLDGRMTIAATIDLVSHARPARARWQAERLDLQSLLRARAPEGSPPRLAGRLGSRGDASAELDRLPETIRGSGIVRIRDGRLILLPGLTQLSRLLNVGSRLIGAGELTHRADIEFDLTPDGVRIRSSTVQTEVLAARASGLVTYSGILDLDVNAGPLEKIQSNLGVVGDMFGRITDRLVTYHVTGPLSDPAVRVAPLGIK